MVVYLNFPSFFAGPGPGPGQGPGLAKKDVFFCSARVFILYGPPQQFVRMIFTLFSRIFGPRGDSASSRLDHGLKIQPGRLR